MSKIYEGLKLMTSSITNKSWLADDVGVRLSKTFKVSCKHRAGALTLITTNKGTFIYSKHSRDYLIGEPENGCWTQIIQLSDNVYLASWKGMGLSTVYMLFDEKLQAINKNTDVFYAVKTLTANLMAVQTEQGWGIVDTVTGKMVEQPKYLDIVYKEGKIIGKTTQVVENEIIIKI